jgi:hypothetical protein
MLDLIKRWLFGVEVLTLYLNYFIVLINVNPGLKIYNFWKKQHFGKTICSNSPKPPFRYWEFRF